MTGDQRHTDHIANGQRVSQQSLPSILYFLFSPLHIFINSILCALANGTLAFAPTAQANDSDKSQRAVSTNAETEHPDKTMDIFSILTS